MKNFKSTGIRTAFNDLLFLLNFGLLVLFVVSFMLISEDKKHDVERPAEYLITMTWNDSSQIDVDTHVLHNESKSWVHYNHRRANHMFLEIDDRGRVTDSYIDEKGVIQYTLINREVVTIREKVAGTYYVNVHLFTPQAVIDSFGEQLPQDVNVTLIQLNPYRELADVTIPLSRGQEEKTAFRFVVLDNKVIEVDTHERYPFVYRNANTQGFTNQ